jgi:hypothetical protein
MRIIALFVAFGVTALAGCGGTNAPAGGATVSAAVDNSPASPPAIKVGVKVELSTNYGSSNAVGELFVVEEVRGDWVRLKGKGFGHLTERGFWVNFANVIWYDVKG